MKLRSVATLSVFALLASCSGKSKVDKCNDVCKKILDEEMAACADEACKSAAKAKNEACLGLCDTAVGEGAKNREADKKAMAKSAEELAASCEKGATRDCLAVSMKYLKGLDGTPKSDKDAAKYMKMACDTDDVFACTMYGKMVRDGRGVAADPAAANALFEKACAKDGKDACTSLGLAAMKTDKAKGAELLTKACDLDDGLGCMGIGSLYLHGNGVTKDLAKAKTLLQKACKLGAQSACKKVGEL
jgi:hypothetical protein